MGEFVDDHKNGFFGAELDNQFHFIAGEMMANEFHLLAGQSLGKHVHDYTHMSILARGIVKLEKFNRGESEPFEVSVLCATLRPVTVIVSANIYHRITAMEDADWFCIHSERGG
jgi:hypothetical protein